MHPNHFFNKVRKALVRAITEQRCEVARPYSNDPYTVRFEGDINATELTEAVVKALEDAGLVVQPDTNGAK